jgi:hypothetical protein
MHERLSAGGRRGSEEGAHCCGRDIPRYTNVATTASGHRMNLYMLLPVAHIHTDDKFVLFCFLVDLMLCRAG